MHAEELDLREGHSPWSTNPTLPLQAVIPPTQESVLMREACYRCIGEGFNHVSNVVDFGNW